MAKFFRRGVSKLKFCPAVAGASPTRAELNAGTDVSTGIAALAGFGLANKPIDTPNLGDRFTSQIDGPDEVTAACELTFYDDDTTTANRTTLAKGTIGYIVLLPYGDVATKRCEVWHVKTLGVNDVPWSTGNEAARFAVPMAVLDPPNQSAVIPA